METRTMAAGITARTEALAVRLEANVTKRALAEQIASKAVVAGLVSGQTPAQTDADLLAELRRYEEVAALRCYGRKREQR
jgi:hypothetical protein